MKNLLNSLILIVVGGDLEVWLDRRYRRMPLDGYDTRYPSTRAFRDNINVKDPVFQRR